MGRILISTSKNKIHEERAPIEDGDSWEDIAGKIEKIILQPHEKLGTKAIVGWGKVEEGLPSEANQKEYDKDKDSKYGEKISKDPTKKLGGYECKFFDTLTGKFESLPELLNDSNDKVGTSLRNVLANGRFVLCIAYVQKPSCGVAEEDKSFAEWNPRHVINGQVQEVSKITIDLTNPGKFRLNRSHSLEMEFYNIFSKHLPVKRINGVFTPLGLPGKHAAGHQIKLKNNLLQNYQYARPLAPWETGSAQSFRKHQSANTVESNKPISHYAILGVMQNVERMERPEQLMLAGRYRNERIARANEITIDASSPRAAPSAVDNGFSMPSIYELPATPAMVKATLSGSNFTPDAGRIQQSSKKIPATNGSGGAAAFRANNFAETPGSHQKISGNDWKTDAPVNNKGEEGGNSSDGGGMRNQGKTVPFKSQFSAGESSMPQQRNESKNAAATGASDMQNESRTANANGATGMQNEARNAMAYGANGMRNETFSISGINNANGMASAAVPAGFHNANATVSATLTAKPMIANGNSFFEYKNHAPNSMQPNVPAIQSNINMAMASSNHSPRVMSIQSQGASNAIQMHNGSNAIKMQTSPQQTPVSISHAPSQQIHQGQPSASIKLQNGQMPAAEAILPEVQVQIAQAQGSHSALIEAGVQMHEMAQPMHSGPQSHSPAPPIRASTTQIQLRASSNRNAVVPTLVANMRIRAPGKLKNKQKKIALPSAQHSESSLSMKSQSDQVEKIKIPEASQYPSIKVQAKAQQSVQMRQSNPAKHEVVPVAVSATRLKAVIPQKGKINGLILDLDGVLVNSEPLHFKVFQEVVAPFGIKIDRNYYYSNYIGRGAKYIFEDLLAKHGIDAPVEPLMEKHIQLVVAHVRKGGLSPMPGAKNLVQLANAKGVEAIVASGSPRKVVESELAAVGLGALPSVTFNDVKHKKPHPEVFLKAAERISQAPSSCLVVEDSPSGALAALNARMPCLLVSKNAPASAKAIASKTSESLSSKTLLAWLLGLFAKGKKSRKPWQYAPPTGTKASEKGKKKK